MARPMKKGLDYFPFDVDFFSDEKLVCIDGEFGLKGQMIVIRLLCAIYKEGYFAVWSERLRLKLLHEVKEVTAGLLDDVVRRLVKWDFFDKGLFDSMGVLTSRGIQRRYFEGAKRRMGSECYPYLLIDLEQKKVNVDNNRVNVYNNRVNVDINPTKKSKVKENKNKKISLAGDEKSAGKPDAFAPAPSEKEVFEFCKANAIKVDPAKFWNYYQAVGWKVKGTPIADWRAKLLEWNAREDEHTAATGAGSGASGRRPLAGQRPCKTDADFIREADERHRREAQREASKGPHMTADDYLKSLGFNPGESLADITVRELAAERARLGINQ